MNTIAIIILCLVVFPLTMVCLYDIICNIKFILKDKADDQQK